MISAGLELPLRLARPTGEPVAIAPVEALEDHKYRMRWRWSHPIGNPCVPFRLFLLHGFSLMPGIVAGLS
jgi:hypothetical protein